MVSCLTTDELDGLLEGGLAVPDRARCEAHVRTCHSCREELDAREADQRLFQNLRRAFRNGSGLSTVPSMADTRASDGRVVDVELPETLEGYEILGELHRGGQGVVFKARQVATNRIVAIKMLLAGPYASPKERFRFEREVELAARLRHPNIVAIHESGIHRGRHYYAMEFVEGIPLNQHLERASLSLPRTLQLFAQICNAVSYAHRLGVIHRDLKPGNILVDADGHPHILDFGLAKPVNPGCPESGPPLTVSGEFLGTLAYASPEQTTGNAGMVDVRSEVYSLGVILYEMLTGNYPYPVVGQMGDVLKAITQAEPQPPSSWYHKAERTASDRQPAASPYRVNAEVETIVLKCLRKEPERRYQSAGELAADIDCYLTGRPISAKSDSIWYVLRKHIGQNLAACIALLAVVVIGLAASGLGLDMNRDRLAARHERDAYSAASAAQRLEFAALGERLEPVLGEWALGWFLFEWQSGRVDRARQIRDEAAGGSPEHAAMSFLLDDSMSIERLLAELPAESVALGHFVDGERHLKAGRHSAALAAFESANRMGRPGVLGTAAAARVADLTAREE